MVLLCEINFEAQLFWGAVNESWLRKVGYFKGRAELLRTVFSVKVSAFSASDQLVAPIMLQLHMSSVFRQESL
jgi:hypothetical protein